MIAARSVTFFASHIPFCDRLRFHIVINGMAAIAGRTGWPFVIVVGVESCPPVPAPQ